MNRLLPLFQVTGNIALCCDNKVLFFEFRAVVTDRHEYIDLLEIPFHVELSFAPTALHFCEGVISCWDATALNIFKIQRVGDSQSISVSFSSELASISVEKSSPGSGGWMNKEAIDFRQVAEQKMLNQSVFRVHMMSDADDFGQCDLKPEAVNNMLVMLKGNGNGDCDLMTKYTIKSLLQLKSRRRRGFSDSFKSVSMRPLYKVTAEVDKQHEFNGHHVGGNIFQSLHSPLLASVSVAVATQQDAYLYHFTAGSSADEWRHQAGAGSGEGALVANYSFTSPVIDLVIDSAVLHALTETGIETYTLRTGQRIFYDCPGQDNEEEILRATDDPICLIGIRSVAAAKKIFCSDTNVAVLIGNDREASAAAAGDMDDGQYLVYNLRKPGMDVIYRNIEEFATRFRFDNPRLFVHLMSEAHVMVRLVVEMSHAIPVDELNRQNLKSIPLITFSSIPDAKLMNIFTESCCSLGDYFVMQSTEEEYYMALPYYLMGHLGVNEIFNRLIQFEKNQNVVRIYLSLKSSIVCGCLYIPLSVSLLQCMSGVVYTLKRLFLRLQPEEALFTTTNHSQLSSSTRSAESSSTDAINYRLEKGNIIRVLYDLLHKYSPSDVAVIALQSQLFANRSGDRIYEFLEKKCERTHEETLCLALQLIRKNSPESARQLMEEFDGRTLIHCLIKHWTILFETSTNHRNGSSIVIFSEFMEVCLLASTLNTVQIVTANVLKYLLVNLQVLPFDVLLKLLIDYSALQIGSVSDGTGRKVLLMTLELYLIDYYAQRRMPRVATRNGSMETSLESATGGAGVASGVQDPQCSDISIRTAESSKSSILTDIDSGLSIFGAVATGKALKILVRSYLGQLKGFSMHQNYNPDELGRVVNGEPKSTAEFEQLEQEINALFDMQKKKKPADSQVELLRRLCGEEMNVNGSEMATNPGHHLLRPILFLDSRLNYLNYMPPLQENFLDTFLKPQEDLNAGGKCHEANISCVKIQALLCSEYVPMDVANEISQFVYTNPHLIGIEGIISCLLPTREAAELLCNVCPQAVLEFSKERAQSEEDWRFLIQCLQRQTNKDTTESNGGMQLFYHRLLKETLEHIANTNSLEAVLRIFPEGELCNGKPNNDPNQRESHYLNELELAQNPFIQNVRQCLERERANKIRMVITAKHPKNSPPPPPPPRTTSRE